MNFLKKIIVLVILVIAGLVTFYLLEMNQGVWRELPFNTAEDNENEEVTPSAE